MKMARKAPRKVTNTTLRRAAVKEWKRVCGKVNKIKKTLQFKNCKVFFVVGLQHGGDVF